MPAVEIKAYIEKEAFALNGVCYQDGCKGANAHSPGAISIPIEKEGQDSTYNVIVTMLKEGEDAIDCIFCNTNCKGYVKESVGSIPMLPKEDKDTECLKKIRWQEDYYEVKGFDADEKKSRNTLTTSFTIPQICNLVGLEFRLEISPCFEDYYPKGDGLIPEDNSLSRTVGKQWSRTWPFTESESCWYPGEYMIIQGVFRDKNKTFKKTIGYGWYETKCLTSGIVQGAGLLDDTLRYKEEKLEVLGYDKPIELAYQNIKEFKVQGYSAGYYEGASESAKLIKDEPYDLKYSDVTDVKVDMTSGISGRVTLDRQIEINEQTGVVTLVEEVVDGSYVYYEIVADIQYKYKKSDYNADLVNGTITVPKESRIPKGWTITVSYYYMDSVMVEGGYLEPYKDDWIGDVRLHWLVLFKGQLVWLKCSDFVAYTIGDRALIYKNGVAQADADYGLRRCRNTDDSSDTDSSTDVISDADVAYTLDRQKDLLLPIVIN